MQGERRPGRAARSVRVRRLRAIRTGRWLESPNRNSCPETVFFWYDPSVDLLIQAEVEPYDVQGLFATEEDAYRFLDWYADQYAIEDTTHLELYAADLDHRGYGLPVQEKATELENIEEPPEQAAFDAFPTEQTGTTQSEDDG